MECLAAVVDVESAQQTVGEDMQLYTELACIVPQDLLEIRAESRKAAQTQDGRAVAALAHQLRGSRAILGARSVPAQKRN